MLRDTLRHISGFLLPILVPGCALVHGRDGDAASVDGTVLCGDARCDVSSRVCVRCEGTWSCVATPDRSMLPDWWTNSQLCDPPGERLTAVPELRCDDHGDCEAGRTCVAEGDQTFCATGEYIGWWDECVGDRGHLCETVADCPPCATRCDPVAGSHVWRCVAE